MQSMLRGVKSSKNTESPEMLELVHMIDTEGQPELLENMPSLIQHSHLAVLVLNLMFGLNDHPSIDFHEKGKAYQHTSPPQPSSVAVRESLSLTLPLQLFQVAPPVLPQDPATDCHLMWLQTSPTESEKPTLLQLYDLNVLKEVGTHYRILGTFLLRDDTGCIVDAIEQDNRHENSTEMAVG